MNASSPGSKPVSGQLVADRLVEAAPRSPSSLVSVSVTGLKSSRPASARAMTVSGEVTKLSVLA